MKLGVMWLCEKDKSLNENIELAAKHIWETRGEHITYCEANISARTDIEPIIETEFVNYILPNHLWLGTKD